MRSLNECLGDGRAIAVRYDDSSVLDSLSELSKDELKKAKEKKMENAAIECAKQVSQRFSGKTCMGTSIHSRLPSIQRHLTFFFDEEYMQKCYTMHRRPPTLNYVQALLTSTLYTNSFTATTIYMTMAVKE